MLASFRRPTVDCNFAILWAAACLVLVARVTALNSPPDYPYGNEANRVFDLVRFFESLEDTDMEKSPISLAEAAEKLHILTSGENMSDMCSRYYKLINQANIRTLATVRELADEHIDDYEHPEANILAKLANERKFDALGRIYTFASLLEPKKNGDGTPAYAAPVQNDLLDCLEHFVYRHGRATDGLVDFIGERRSLITVSDAGAKRPGTSLARYQPLMDRVGEIEARHFSRPTDYIGWVEALTDLQRLALQDGLTIPRSVEDLLRQPERLNRLKLLAKMLREASSLKMILSDFERGLQSDYCKNLEDYVGLLDTLVAMIKEKPGKFPSHIVEFAKAPSREAFVEKSTLEEYESGISSKRCQDLKDYIDILERLIRRVESTDNGEVIAHSVVDFVHDPRRKMFIEKWTLEDFEKDIPSRECGTLDEYIAILARLRQSVESSGESVGRDIVDFLKHPGREAFVEKQKQLAESRVPYISEKPEKNALTKEVPLEMEEIGNCKEWLGDLCRIRGRTVDLYEVHRYVSIFNKLEDLCYNRYEDATKYVDRKRQLFYSFLEELRQWHSRTAQQYEADPSRMTNGDREILHRTKLFLDANQVREASLREQNILT